MKKKNRGAGLTVIALGLRGMPNVPGGIEVHASELYPRLQALGAHVIVMGRTPYRPAGSPTQWQGVTVRWIASPQLQGVEALANYLVREIQDVYRLQGVKINDKHIEVIIRQMLRKTEVQEIGETTLLRGEQLDRARALDINDRAQQDSKAPARLQPVLLGITKASLETDSFLSAASFQDTTRVLTEAATRSKIDSLRGFKENVIMGHIIPAGTGFDYHRRVTLRPLVEVPDQPEPEPVREEAEAENPLLA